MSSRYAVYFAPDPASDLWQRGSRWLGRDAATDRAVPRSADGELASLSAARITETPAKYGFHATFKAPFLLAEGETPDRLLSYAAGFACRHAPVILPGLQVSAIGDFVALVPAGETHRIDELAAACVMEFDRFRAPPDAGELTRRRQATLTARQTELLGRWGYPYVMEEFRFHMTLTGSLTLSERTKARRILAEHFGDLASTPTAVVAIAIFEQPSGDSPFRILERFPLTGR